MADIEVDTNTKEEFKVPKKAMKRKMSEGERMETESSGVESSTSDVLSKVQRPAFPPIKKEKLSDGTEVRKIPVPSHRYSPLKENWMKIFEPIVEHLKLQIRFNLKTRNVEIRTHKDTEDISSIQKAADFVKAFIYGFEVEDALAIIRLDDLFIDSFEVTVSVLSENFKIMINFILFVGCQNAEGRSFGSSCW